MSDEPRAPEAGSEWDEDPDLQETRLLLASVEELRALLAPLVPEDRERVLELARHLKEHPGGVAPAQ
ncbi:MAG TPA: hypothetical protein VIE12_12570 [Actinomycetota bacterium]|jgi:hypothetical protein